MAKMGEIKKEVTGILHKYLGDDYLLIVFGSFARNKIQNSSDIDLAIYKSGKIPTRIILEIKEDLNEKVHSLREIDLINLTDENSNTELLKSILNGGVIWHKAKNSKELLILSAQARNINISRIS